MSDDRADVIEQAVKVLRDQHISHVTPISTRIFARALSDAGLLVSPADQDNAAEPWANAFRYWRKRALDVEAEVERLTADLHEARRHTDQAWGRVEYWRDSELPAARAENDRLRGQLAAVRSTADRLWAETEEPVVADSDEIGRAVTVCYRHVIAQFRDALDTAGGEQP